MKSAMRSFLSSQDGLVPYFSGYHESQQGPRHLARHELRGG
jgi:hypothetical protein